MQETYLLMLARIDELEREIDRKLVDLRFEMIRSNFKTRKRKK